MGKVLISLILSVFLVVSVCFAEEKKEAEKKEAKFEEIVVTATKNPKELEDVPASTTVITTSVPLRF